MEKLIRPTRHSYSALSKYEGCPARYKYSYIDKLPDPSGAAAKRGTRIHSTAERYLLGEIGKLPIEFWKVEPFMRTLVEKKAVPEAVWMVDRLWEPAKSDEDGYVKAVVDVHYIDGDTLHLWDFKTGKRYDSHVDQLKLYATMALTDEPIMKVEVGAVYIDEGEVACEAHYNYSMLPMLIDGYNERIYKLEADTEFMPQPSNGCKYCPYRASKGGPCQFAAE